MKQSLLFTKTRKENLKDEISKNAQLLIRAGFVNKELAGAYAYLPLGLRVLSKINQIIREEMNSVGGQELILTALQDKEVWEKTNRWSDEIVDNWFKTSLKNSAELGLGFSHEEPLAKLMKNHISSYKDLPVYVYQIQTKFRNEARAKSGLMRGREFLMKDLYSFSLNQEEHNIFYEKMKDVYMKVFARMGLGERTYLTISSGGSFSKYSYEFQMLSSAGEDIIYIIDESKKIAINKDDFNDELLSDFNIKVNKSDLKVFKSIEIGDIYTLAYKYSEAYNLSYIDKDGQEKLVFMGSYGMSPSRLMGSIVEVYNDEKGIIWPLNVAPFAIHLISLNQNEEAEKVYQELNNAGFEVLYDDRDLSLGQKLNDADLIGCPYRVIVSEKNIKNNQVEIKKRSEKEAEMISRNDLINFLKDYAK